jgi:hypothetical protein
MQQQQTLNFKTELAPALRSAALVLAASADEHCRHGAAWLFCAEEKVEARFRGHWQGHLRQREQVSLRVSRDGNPHWHMIGQRVCCCCVLQCCMCAGKDAGDEGTALTCAGGWAPLLEQPCLRCQSALALPS